MRKTGIGVATLAAGDEEREAASATIVTTRANPTPNAAVPTIRFATFPMLTGRGYDMQLRD